MTSLTKFQALYVMYLRCRCNGTWRWVANKYQQRYNIEGDIWSSQFLGRHLCEMAEQTLGVKPNSITQVVL